MIGLAGLLAGVFPVVGCESGAGGGVPERGIAGVERGESDVAGDEAGIWAGDAVAARRVSAEWDDVDPALRFAVSEHGLAVVRRRMNADSLRDATELAYELLSVRDEPGMVRIAREDASGELGARRGLTIEASIGRFGDAERAAELVETIAKRLGVLAEHEIAPVDD